MRFIFCILLLISTQSIAQQLHIVRTSTSMAGSSGEISISDKKVLIRQSIGQQTVSNISLSNNLQMRQGFLQPFIAQPQNKEVDHKTSAVYPNPFDSKIFITFPKVAEIINVEIYHTTGALRLKKTINNQQNIDIATSSLPKGTYLIRISTESETTTRQVLKN